MQAKNSNQIILGIDPGYERCGYAFLQKNKSQCALLDYGAIRTQAHQPFAERLAEIATDFKSLLEKYNPQILVIEDLFFAQNTTTGLKVSEVRGVLTYLGHEAGCQTFHPKPVEIKKSFTGNGKAHKSEMKKMVELTFPEAGKNMLDDTADAIAAAFWGMSVL